MHGFQNIHCNADSNTYILPYIFIPKVQIIIFFYIALILLQLIMAYLLFAIKIVVDTMELL